MGTRVYIGRLPYQVRERDVERFFKGYGRVREIMLKNGYGFVVSDLSYVQGLLAKGFLNLHWTKDLLGSK